MCCGNANDTTTSENILAVSYEVKYILVIMSMVDINPTMNEIKELNQWRICFYDSMLSRCKFFPNSCIDSMQSQSKF